VAKTPASGLFHCSLSRVSAYFSVYLPPIIKIPIMGRGDKKTAKGKRFKGSYGKSRPASATKSKKFTVKTVEAAAS
jgi:30S ribosomal protein S31